MCKPCSEQPLCGICGCGCVCCEVGLDEGGAGQSEAAHQAGASEEILRLEAEEERRFVVLDEDECYGWSGWNDFTNTDLCVGETRSEFQMPFWLDGATTS